MIQQSHFQQSHFWVYSQRSWNQYLKDAALFLLCAHGSIIHSSQDMEST